MRRLVAGLSAEGKSITISDAVPHRVISPGEDSGLLLTELWSTDDVPPAVERGPRDPTTDASGSPLGPGGTRFQFVELAPGAGMPTHSTTTIDYLIVISGEIHLGMEDDPHEQRLGPGDAAVQLAGRHSWQNRSEEPCLLAVVVVGAQESNEDRP